MCLFDQVLLCGKVRPNVSIAGAVNVVGVDWGWYAQNAIRLDLGVFFHIRTGPSLVYFIVVKYATKKTNKARHSRCFTPRTLAALDKSHNLN